MTICVGYEKRVGTFTDKETKKTIEYDNVLLHVLHSDSANVVGQSCEVVKVNSRRATFKGCKTLDDLIGKEIYLIVGRIYKKPNGTYEKQIDSVVLAPQ